MAGKLKESDFAKWCLQIAFALFLFTVVLIALSQILFSILSNIASLDERPVWIGFWGNIIGGLLGLAGGLVAAYAAVRAVERQLKQNELDKELAVISQLNEFATGYLISARHACRHSQALEVALTKRDLKAALRYASGLFLLQLWADKRMRAQWSMHTPEVAYHFSIFLGLHEQLYKSVKDAKAHVNDGKETDASVNVEAAGHMLHLVSAATVLFAAGVNLCAALAARLPERQHDLAEVSVGLSKASLELQVHWKQTLAHFEGLGGDPDL